MTASLGADPRLWFCFPFYYYMKIRTIHIRQSAADMYAFVSTILLFEDMVINIVDTVSVNG